MKTLYLSIFVFALFSRLEAVEPGCALDLQQLEARIAHLARTIVDKGKLQTDPTKATLVATMESTIEAERAELLKTLSLVNLTAKIEAAVASHESTEASTSDYDLAAAFDPAKKEKKPEDLTDEEIRLVKKAAAYGNEAILNASSAMIRAIDGNNQEVVQGFVLGATKEESACKALGSRCYGFKIDLRGPISHLTPPETFLSYALRKGRSDIALDLLKSGLSAPLSTALDMKDGKATLAMLSSGIKPTKSDFTAAIIIPSGNPPRNGLLAEAILDFGYKPDEADLVETAKAGSVQLLTKLVEMHPQLKSGFSDALIETINADKIENLRYLISKGASVNLPAKDGVMIPIAVAAKANNPGALKLLIDSRASLQNRRIDAEDPLAIAILNARLDIVKILILAGGDLQTGVSRVQGGSNFSYLELASSAEDQLGRNGRFTERDLIRNSIIPILKSNNSK